MWLISSLCLVFPLFNVVLQGRKESRLFLPCSMQSLVGSHRPPRPQEGQNCRKWSRGPEKGPNFSQTVGHCPIADLYDGGLLPRQQALGHGTSIECL